MRKVLLYCAVLFVALLFLPMIQRLTDFLPRMQLAGTQTKMEKPELSIKTWMDGSFQSDYEKYFSRRMGMRGYLIKSYNQLNFSLFKNTPDTGTKIVVGEGNILYENEYIKTYNRGTTYKDKHVRPPAEQIRLLQDKLKERGIAFLTVISPSKAEIYPESIPSYRRLPDRANRPTKYDVMIPVLHELGVEVLDTKPLFKEWREQETYPLFAKTGTHWNYVAVSRVAGLIMDRLSEQLGRELPTIELESVTIDNEIAGTDNDLGDLLNIWMGGRLAGPQYHPVVKRTSGDEEGGLNILFIGDSFTLTLIEVMDEHKLFANDDLYFYFKRRFTSPKDLIGESLDYSKLQWHEDIFKRDAIIFQNNEIHLPQIGFGFVEEALKALEAVPSHP